MKRGKKLLILTICLVVVSVAAWGAAKLFATEDQIIPMDSGDTIFVLGDTKTLSWVYEDTQIVFDISGEEWVYSQDDTYVISKLYKSDILEQLTDLKSQKVITQPGDLADYGLAKPICTITADEKVLLFGDATAVGGHRYVSVGDGKVYLVSDTALFPFRHSLEEMMEIPSLPDLDTVTALTITTEAETLELTCDADGNWQLYDGQELVSVTANVGESLTGYLKKLRLTDCADIDLQEIEAYGLDVPCATYHISYTDEAAEGTLILMIGDACDDGVYVTTEGANRVYLISEETGMFLGQLDTDTLLGINEATQ